MKYVYSLLVLLLLVPAFRKGGRLLRKTGQEHSLPAAAGILLSAAAAWGTLTLLIFQDMLF